MNKVKGAVYGLVGSALLTANAYAEPAGLDISGFDADISTVMTLGAAIVTALGGMWILRKVIKTINRS
jgi:hypothetical protein